MKYICMSYLGPITWETMSESERKASMDEFFAYDEMLRKNGNVIGGEGLQNAQIATTLRFQNGNVTITDGPYAETKEQLAGFFVLEARDLDHAIQLMSKHPVVRGGAVEIRPAADHTEMNREREQWRSKTRVESTDVEPILARQGGLSYLEIPATDVLRSARFYEKVLGWLLRGDKVDEPKFSDPEGHLIGRWVTGRAIVREPGFLPYIYVKQVRATVEKVAAHGGEVLKAPYPEGTLLVALIRDPAGNVIGLWQAGSRSGGA